ncbi:Chitin binding domain [Trinorchestia longiramus]|nr:Chitin binding domain [Trinorchestia longiramus]
MLPLNLFFCFFILLTTKGECTKLGEHDHHHDHHHQDHHQHQNSIRDKNTNDFVLNEDIFAKALAAEVNNGLFSPLPEKTNDRNKFFTASPNRGSTRFRVPSTLFTNPSTVTQRTTLANAPNNNNSSAQLRTTPATGSETEKGAPQNLQEASNQEILTPIMSQASRVSNGAQRNENSLRLANNVIKQNSPFPQTTTELNDPTGFAPRAPPKTAKQFDPFSSNKNAAKQQLAKFQIKPQNNAVDTTGFAPRTPPPNARKFNPVPTKKSAAAFRKTESSASVAKEIRGFVPVSPPPTAPQFNPVPGAANTATFNFPTTVGFPNNELTTQPPIDFTDVAYDLNYDNNYDSTSEYDYEDLGSAGKTLLDDQNQFSVTTDFSVLNTEDYPTDLDSNIGIPLPAVNSGARAPTVNVQSQINVLGALSSTGNILNSPKYNSNNHDSHSDDATHSPQRPTTLQVSPTTAQPLASTARQSSLGINANVNVGSVVSGPSAPTNQVTNGRSSISDQLTQFTAGNNAVQSSVRLPNTNIPVEARENFEIGVPLSVIADSGASLQQLDSNQFSTDSDLTTGRQLTPQAGLSAVDGEFPQYARVPATSFSCEDQRYSGYFADPEADCQVFHICLNSRNMGSFLCPNGTLFHQQFFVCDWWYNVRCEEAVLSYDLNSLIGEQDNPEAGGIFGSQLRDTVQGTLRFDVDEDDYDDVTDDDLTLLNYDTDEKK